MNTYTTEEMLNQVIKAKGSCLECMKILDKNIYSTYFIYHKKSFLNGEISFVVEYDSDEEIWTNFDFEVLKDYKWKIYEE